MIKKTYKKKPKVGVGTLVFNHKGQILLGKRIYEPIGWCMPGGHIEFGETIIDCCKRETKEEAGCDIENIEIMTVGENIFTDKDYHSIMILAFCTIRKIEDMENQEVDKFECWEWFDIDDLPTNFSFNYNPSIFKKGYEFFKKVNK